MHDPRFQTLADLIVTHSCAVQSGDKVLVDAVDIPDEFVVLLIRTIAAAGGLPLCEVKHGAVLRELYRHASVEQMSFWGEVDRTRMEGVQAYVALRGTVNSSELADVPAEQLAIQRKHHWQRVHTEVRVPNTRWVVLRWPNPSFAQQARMSTEAFEDFYFDVCTVDYKAMARSMEPLAELMERTADVRITGAGTDLSFSISGIPVVGCAGERNIPDGEMFTSPVRDSVNGTLRVNTESLYQGTVFSDVTFRFKDGKIVEESANHAERITKILDIDEGARYVGEFSLGFNPAVRTPMLDTLFDEKIAGSFHFTPGQAYEEADNGNRSAIHWDLVTIQRPEYGGGEISFDGQVIRRDGLFLPEALQGLNPPD